MEVLLSHNDPLSFIPTAAIIVYNNNKNDKYLELHKIYRDGTMGEGMPASRKFIKQMLSSLSQEYQNTIHGTMENILYCDPRINNETLVWYNPPMKRERFFTSDLALEDGTYHVPGTIYAVKDHKLWVFCFKGKVPKMDSILLHGPFFNIYDNGSVCTGNVKLDMAQTIEKTYKNVTHFWENVFWNSIDVHTISSISTKHNLIETIRQYKDKTFNVDELIPYKTPYGRELSLETFIETIK